MSRSKTLRPTYAEISLKAFGHNLEKARELSGTDVMAVIKADGYGHGDVYLGQYAMEKHDCTSLGVATVEEALKLRGELGGEPDIYILGHIQPEHFEEVIKADIIITVGCRKLADELQSFLAERDMKADVSVKINTGMNRIGFTSDIHWKDFCDKYSNFNIVHVLSHNASADTDREFTEKQCKEFESFVTQNDIKCSVSLMNSAGIAEYENRFSFTRPGIMLYGYLEGKNDVKLEKVMRIYSRIVQIQHIKEGEGVSYNHRFYADRDMSVGVVPMGYADGYPRCLSNKSYVFVDGVKCRLIGTVCMDMFMVDLSGVDLDGELIVEILGDNIGADELAEMAGTISYEILTGIQTRIPRIYTEG